jgi:hypothetical protein
MCYFWSLSTQNIPRNAICAKVGPTGAGVRGVRISARRSEFHAVPWSESTQARNALPNRPSLVYGRCHPKWNP